MFQITERRLAVTIVQPSRKGQHPAAYFDPASRRTDRRLATGGTAFSMLTAMSRMLDIVCVLGALLGGPAAAQGFRRGPHMGFGPHPGFFSPARLLPPSWLLFSPRFLPRPRI
jgi:hypothetical protein